MGYLEYPHGLGDLGSSEYSDGVANAISFSFFERKSSQQSNLTRQVFLYMPQIVENNTSTSWTQEPIGSVAGQILDGNNESGILGLLSSHATSVGNGLSDKLQGLLSGSTNISGAENVASLKNRQIKNPYIKVMFKGQNYRNFEFRFTFTPRTKSESDSILKIIKTFRRAQLPKKTSGIYLQYPQEVEIEYIQLIDSFADTNKWLNKFKRCVITDVNVNYTSAGSYAVMRDGFPAQSVLTVRFVENELLFADDIDEGF